MTPYDAAMLSVLVLGMIWGTLRGLTWQIASIASLALGYVVAFPLSSQLAPHFPGEPVIARTLALMASYIGVSGGVFLVAWLVRATLRRWKFEAFDRHLGMIFGGVEGLILGVVVTLFVVSLAPQTRTPIFSSTSGRVVSRVLNAVGPVLPGEIRGELGPFLDPTGTSLAGDRELTAPVPWGKSAPKTWDQAKQDAGDFSKTLIRNLVDEGESRVDQAIKKATEESVDWTGKRHDREVERR